MKLKISKLQDLNKTDKVFLFREASYMSLDGFRLWFQLFPYLFKFKATSYLLNILLQPFIQNTFLKLVIFYILYVDVLPTE